MVSRTRKFKLTHYPQTGMLDGNVAGVLTRDKISRRCSGFPAKSQVGRRVAEQTSWYVLYWMARKQPMLPDVVAASQLAVSGPPHAILFSQRRSTAFPAAASYCV